MTFTHYDGGRPLHYGFIVKMETMAAIISPFSHFSIAFPHSSTNFSAGPIFSTRVSNSKESEVLEPLTKQDKLSNSKPWTTSTNGLEVYQYEMIQPHKCPPLVTALKVAAEENAATFHFPGHNRGQGAPLTLTKLIGQRLFLHDLTELPELGSLFAPAGPIHEAQNQAARLFGASETWFLVGGTTCGIQAAIMGTCNPGDTLILPRNSHISAISAMVLSGIIPKYIFPEYDFEWDIASAVSPSEVERAIKELDLEGRTPAAVFITSPSYHGICSNLNKIAGLCHSRNIPLIVDEAHGAHFGFHPQLPISALQQGADLAVQSTHKVLCSLTQSSMLHLSGKIVDRERICRCLQTLESTSPSYLLLASLDAATAQLAENPIALFDDVIHLAIKLKNTIKQIPGISILESLSSSDFRVIDPLRVTIGFSDLGLSGCEADDFLYKDQKVIPELVGSHSITLPFTPGTCEEHVPRLVLGLNHLSSTFFQHQKQQQITKNSDLKSFNHDINMQLIPREAFFAKKRKVDTKHCVGKICGELICQYPPGIPVMVPGEVITERALGMLEQAKGNGDTISGMSDPLLTSLVICDV